jgi:hypothetical protein
MGATLVVAPLRGASRAPARKGSEWAVPAAGDAAGAVGLAEEIRSCGHAIDSCLRAMEWPCVIRYKLDGNPPRDFARKRLARS